MLTLQRNTTTFPRWNYTRTSPKPITYCRLKRDFSRSFEVQTLANDRAWMLYYNTHNEKRRCINILKRISRGITFESF